MIKTLSTEETSLTCSQISEKPIESIVNWKTVNTFLVTSKTRSRKSALIFTEHCAKDPSKCNKARKRKKRHTDEKVKSVIVFTHKQHDCIHVKSERIYF